MRGFFVVSMGNDRDVYEGLEVKIDFSTFLSAFLMEQLWVAAKEGCGEPAAGGPKSWFPAAGGSPL